MGPRWQFEPPPGVEVTLSVEAMVQALMVGGRRTIAAARKALRSPSQARRTWDIDIEGAMAEMAVAKATGMYFEPELDKFGDADVGQLHVRHTVLPDGCLIIRPEDPEGRYCLVTGQLGRYRIVGCIDSLDARQDIWMRAPQGRPAAWFVPQSALM